MHFPGLTLILLLVASLAIVWIWPSYWVSGGIALAGAATFLFFLEEAAGRAPSLDNIPLRLLIPLVVFAFALFALTAWRKRSLAQSKPPGKTQ